MKVESPVPDGPLPILALISPLDPNRWRLKYSSSVMPLITQSLMPELKAQYLPTLPAIRDRCAQVHNLAKQGKLEYFEYHLENEEKVADFCLQIIQVVGVFVLSQNLLTGSRPLAKQRDFQTNYGSISPPPHGRWRHIDAGLPRAVPLLERWIILTTRYPHFDSPPLPGHRGIEVSPMRSARVKAPVSDSYRGDRRSCTREI